MVKLRQWYLSKDDIESFRQIVRRADHSLTDGFFPEYYSKGCEYRWIKGMVDNLVFGDELHYAVDVDGKAVGCVNVSRCGGVHSRMGVLRLVLLPEMCGHGIGTQVVGLVVREALLSHVVGRVKYEGNFERLHARVIGNNPAAERVLEENGFVCEGTLHNAARKNDQTFDMKVYGRVLQAQDSVVERPLPEDLDKRIALIHKLLDQS